MTPLVVVAPDSFKGTIGAPAAAAALAEGWRSVRPADDVRTIPQADGGEGTADIVHGAVPGSRWRDAGPVTGPDGTPVPGRWLELPDGTALVELAQVSGLPLMRRPDPVGATTTGLGQVLRRAVEAGAPRIVVAVGGSASTDGGAGALTALGLDVTDDDGVPVPAGGGGLGRATRVSAGRALAPPPGGVDVLVDVGAPLLGPRGAASTYGPQKGAGPAEVEALDAALARWAGLLGGDPDRPGSGAAGGTAYGLAVAWGASLVPGAERVSLLTGLSRVAPVADVVLTGEGRFDATSTDGKVVGRVLELARPAHVGVVAGSVAVEGLAAAAAIGHPPGWSCDLGALAGSSERASAEPARWLRKAGARAAVAVQEGAGVIRWPLETRAPTPIPAAEA